MKPPASFFQIKLEFFQTRSVKSCSLPVIDLVYEFRPPGYRVIVLLQAICYGILDPVLYCCLSITKVRFSGRLWVRLQEKRVKRPLTPRFGMIFHLCSFHAETLCNRSRRLRYERESRRQPALIRNLTNCRHIETTVCSRKTSSQCCSGTGIHQSVFIAFFDRLSNRPFSTWVRCNSFQSNHAPTFFFNHDSVLLRNLLLPIE